jgi:hypothetical protein
MQGGRIVGPMPSLEEIRGYCRDQREALPEGLRRPDSVGSYPVSYSEVLEDEARRLGVKTD